MCIRDRYIFDFHNTVVKYKVDMALNTCQVKYTLLKHSYHTPFLENFNKPLRITSLGSNDDLKVPEKINPKKCVTIYLRH